jgi:hypothetical protein
MRGKLMFSFKSTPSLALITTSLVTVQLLGGCNSKGSETEVKDYSASDCTASASGNLQKNVASLVSGFFIFNDGATQPTSASIKLGGQSATGKTEVATVAFSFPMRERLEPVSKTSSEIKIASWLSLPTTQKSQTFQFSQPCQINNALSENEVLRIEPTQGTLYVLYSYDGFILLVDGAPRPPQHLIIKMQLLNPQNGKREEATFNLNQVATENHLIPDRLEKSWQLEDTKEAKWRIVKNMHPTRQGESKNFYNLVKEENGNIVRVKIEAIEFVPEEIK